MSDSADTDIFVMLGRHLSTYQLKELLISQVISSLMLLLHFVHLPNRFSSIYYITFERQNHIDITQKSPLKYHIILTNQLVNITLDNGLWTGGTGYGQ